MTGAPATPRVDQIPRGILFMVASTVLFAGGNAMVKWMVARYPVGEVAFLRAAFGLIPLYLVILPRTGLRVFHTSRPLDHLKRAASQFCSMMSMFLAFLTLPLATAVAISFSAPLFTTLLSILILKDRVGVHRWSALAVGFVGVLIITRPGAGSIEPGTLFALLNAVMISTVAIAIRRMSATESTETLAIWQLTLITLFTACLLPLGVVVPTPGDLALIAAAGLANGIAQYWWTKALHLAPPSAVVPFNYLSLVWATAIGFAVWGDVPGPHVLAGMIVIAGSGLYIVWREAVRRRARVLTDPGVAPRSGPA